MALLSRIYPPGCFILTCPSSTTIHFTDVHLYQVFYTGTCYFYICVLPEGCEGAWLIINCIFMIYYWSQSFIKFNIINK